MAIEIWPSIMCADFGHLAESLRQLEDAGADGIHLDVMDGHFVPNITFGPLVVEAIRANTRLPLEAHLMVTNPDLYIGDFVKAGADIITIHAEAPVHLQRSLQTALDAGARAAVALNPATSPSAIEYVLDDVSMALVMTVNPGFSGQDIVASALPKIDRLHAMIAERRLDVRIAVDGHVSPSTAPDMVRRGAQILIGGRSGVFLPDLSLAEAISQLRAAAAAK
ncbi:MAG: ribulose-phosphate 3-epimerase [Armatimonadota bacterium]|nr:MAG: ribulose-phosphate 3-epimerase [Armatimonadota bacterium]